MDNEKIEQIVRNAFAAGESWALCYSTWFAPSDKDTEEKIQAALKAALESIDTTQ